MAETVKSLAQQVAAGTLDAAEAGRRMRGKLSVLKLAKTDAQRREQFNQAAYEDDPNSFVHVSALYDSGQLTKAEYTTIRGAVG